MNILVTGGFGFIGSHLVELLLRDSAARVHVVDNLSTSPLPLQDLLAEMGTPSQLTYSVVDVDRFCLEWDGPRFDEIYHLASVVGPAGVLQHAGTIARSIVNDVTAVATLALRHEATLVDVSTSEVYGGGQEGFCSEEMPKVVGPAPSARLEYAVGKLAGEVAVLNLCRTQRLRARVVRPFNVSGPRQSGRGGFVLPRFIAQALLGMDLTVFGDGSQVRAFTHVRDLATGIVLAMRRGRAGEAYNLGNEANRCTIRQLADDVLAVSGSRVGVTFMDPRAIYGPHYAEANDKFPDAAKAVAELGWRPQHGRVDTVAATYEYMRSVSNALFERLAGFDAGALA